MMKVEFKEMPPLRLATIRHIGPYDQIGKAFERLGAIAGAAALFGRAGAAMVAVYYDDPETIAADELRSDAAIAIPDSASVPAGLVEQRIPGGTYISTLHIGPYDGLPDAWRRLKQERASSARPRRAGASYEIYLNDPTTTPKEELRTEIYVPVDE